MRCSLLRAASSLQATLPVRLSICALLPFTSVHVLPPFAEEALTESIRYLEEAEQCFGALDMFVAQMDVQFMLSVVHHNLGAEAQRDEVAQRHEETRVKREEAHACVVEGWIEETWTLVADVGIAIASR